MEENTNVQTEVKETYTKAEVEQMIQAEADRRVSKAMETQQKKMEKKIAEATKLAQMTEAEKYEYQLKEREAKIAAKEKELALAHSRNFADKALAEKGIDLALVDLVVSEDEETMKARIEMLDKTFQASVKAEVEKRLGSKTPRQTSPTETEITQAQFRKMSIAELSHLAATRPEVYDTLANSK